MFIEKNIQLKTYNTFAINAYANSFTTFNSVEELGKVLESGEQVTNNQQNSNNSSFLGKYIGGPIKSALGGLGRLFFGGETLQVCTNLDGLSFRIQSKSQVIEYIYYYTLSHLHKY